MKIDFEGSVSIFLTLCLVPMVLCAGLIIDAFKISTAKSEIANADDLASNAVASTYDIDLYELYGLFATNKNNTELSSLGGYYFGSNLLSKNSVFKQNSYSRNFVNGIFSRKMSEKKDNLTNLSPEEFNISFDKNSCIANPEVLERQITDHMKLRGPLYLSEGILEKANILKSAKTAMDFNKQQKKQIGQIKNKLKNIESLSGKIQPLRKSNFDNDLKILKESITNIDDKKLTETRKNLKEKIKSIQKIKDEAQNYSDHENKSKKEDTEESKIKTIEKDYKKIVEDKQTYMELIDACNKDIDFLTTLYNKSDPEKFTLKEKDFINEDLNVTKDPDFIMPISSESSEDETQAKDFIKTLETIADSKEKVLSKGKDNINSYISTGTRNEILSFVNLQEQNPSSEQNFLSKINITGKKAYNNLLISEYIDKYFPCNTELQDVTGRFGEAEYILWGNEDLDKNIVLTQSSIFAIRMAANSMYIFTDPVTREKALAFATALSSVSGVGVIAFQNIILFTWSVAESLTDLVSLNNGNTVPIFKNSKTLAISPSGIKNVIGKTLDELGTSKIDDIYEYITHLTTDNISKAENTFYNYSDNFIQGKADQMLSVVLTPIEQEINQIVYLGTKQLSATEVEQRINKIFDDELKKYSSDNKITDAIIRQIKKEFSKEISLTVTELRRAIIKNEKDIIQKEKIKLDSIKNRMVEKIQNYVKSYTKPIADNFKNQIKSVLDSNKDNICDELHQKLNEFQNKIEKVNIDNTDDKQNKSGMVLGLSYREYLQLFTYLSLNISSKKQAMLARAAECISINMKNKNQSFKIISHYTKWTDKVKVNINTIFIGMFARKYKTGENMGNFYCYKSDYIRGF